MLLGREGLVRRARSVKRATRNGIQWGVRAFYAGNVLAATIGECQLRSNEDMKSGDAQSRHENPSQIDLLLSLICS
jgi:hypothetical protein